MDLSSPETRALVDNGISAIKRSGFRRLCFSEELEKHFDLTTSVRRSRRILIEGILCFIVFNFFAVSDYFLARRIFLESLAVRLELATPMAIASLFVLHRRRQIKWVRESLMLFVCCMFSACVLYL